MSSQPYASTTFDTDTATLAIFDPAALAHRITDTADWWSIAEDALAEINAGNCLLYTSPSPRDVEESRMPSSA